MSGLPPPLQRGDRGDPFCRRPFHCHFVAQPRAKSAAMKFVAKTVLSGLSLAWLAVQAASTVAEAQTSFELQNPNVLIDYIEPRKPDDPQSATYGRDLASYERHMKIYERMKRRQVLEQFSQFLAPLKLPRILRVSIERCGISNAFYNGQRWSIVICYEIIDGFEAQAPKTMSPEGITRAEAILGAIVDTLLHEGGHAVSDMLRLPVLGREEDAADEIAGFIMVQFGEEVARTAIKGVFYDYLKGAERNGGIYWDTHSTPAQRYANYLCMAYGRYPDLFKELAERWLSPQRAENCPHEYQRALNAFNKTIRRHVDEDLMERVRKLPVFRPGDGEW
jgi:hypothetical protein